MSIIKISKGLFPSEDSLPDDIYPHIKIGTNIEDSDRYISIHVKEGELNRCTHIIMQHSVSILGVPRGDIHVQYHENLVVIGYEAQEEEVEEELDVEMEEYEENDAETEAAFENEAEQAVPQVNNPETTNTGVTGPSKLGLIIPITDKTIISNMIAKTMENQLSSSVKETEKKIADLERLMLRALELRREIDEENLPVMDNPIIKNLISQVDEIASHRDSAIDEICFVDGFIQAKTKELITDGEIDGSRRVIGRMSIKVDLKVLSGKSTGSDRPVEIKNLDRRYHSLGGALWECGHIKSNGAICWGNAQEQLYAALHSRNIEAVLDVVVRFVKNPNPSDSWGSHIKHWPAANIAGGAN